MTNTLPTSLIFLLASFLRNLPQRPLQHLLLLPSHPKRFQIRIILHALNRRQSQRLSHLILFSLLDLPDFLLLLLFCTELGSFVALGIPVQIFTLLPTAHRRH